MNTNNRMALIFALSVLAISGGVYVLNVSSEFDIFNPARVWLDSFSLIIGGIIGTGSVIANKFRPENRSPLIDLVEIERRTDSFLDHISASIYGATIAVLALILTIIAAFTEGSTHSVLNGFGYSFFIISIGLILWNRLLKE